MRKIVRSLCSAGLEKAEFDRLMKQARRENERNLKVYSLIALALFLILSIAHLITHVFATGTLLCYAGMTAFSAAVYALSRLARVRTTALCYAFVAGLYAFSLAVSALNPALPAVTAIAVMLMGPFLFTERPVYLILLNIVAAALLCALSFRLKSRQLALIDLWNALAFGVISVAAEITQENMRFRLMLNTERVHYLSETDVLTGCKNRNCYQERLPHFPAMCRRSLTCVYVDVNGLHHLNDTKGHEAGDAMLQSVALVLMKAFDPEHTYRIGGDEFVAICPDADAGQTRRRTAQAADELAKMGYDISAGVETADKNGLDVGELVKRAEHGMYQIKQAYYEQAGHNRRRRE